MVKLKIRVDKSSRRRFPREIASKAAEAIGEHSAIDMLDFSSLNKSDIDTIYVKDRDGTPMAAGIKKILPNADVIFLHTERTGFAKDKVNITPLDSKNIKLDENSIRWFADPINARGTTSIEVLRYFYDIMPFDLALLSHIVANVHGINNIQTLITDFNMSSFMNYAFLSNKLNMDSGFLEDALEITPDFGDKVFGTIGRDYSDNQMLENLKILLDTHAGEVEKLRGFILLLLYGKDIYTSDKDVGWATGKWIKESILWYMKNRHIKINLKINPNFDIILKELEERGFIKHDEYPWEFGKSKFKAYDYYLTEEGTNITHKWSEPLIVDSWLSNST